MSPDPREPLISVALCTLNGARFLQAQLESLSAQDYPRFEIVAVDDGSADGTWSMLESHARADARLRVWRNRERLGLAGNFERALSLCRGELIACCDQDDLWLPSHLSELAAALGRHSLVYCDSRLIDSDGRELGRMSDSRNMISGSQPLAFVFFNCVSGHAMLFRREILARARPFPEHGFHDWWLAYVASVVGSIGYLDRCLVDYRRHDAMATTARHRARELDRAPGFRLTDHERQVDWIRRLARLPGAPGRVERLAELVSRWGDRIFAWELAGVLLAWSEELFAISSESRTRRLLTALKWLAGGRLRSRILPRRWRPPAPGTTQPRTPHK